MPFFHPAYLSPQADFLKLLSELDNAQDNKCAGRRQQCKRPEPTFTPRFDITEVAQAYELFGEVAGLEQDDLSIEFSDAQTLVIKGKTARPTFTALATEPTQPETSDASSEKSHNATVEDEYDEADTPLATPATAVAEPATTDATELETTKPKYWVAERKVGSFARSFSFSQRIEQDEVQASLKNGILHVVVPKSQKPRRVAVSVK